jgi:hypothetical protein
LPRQGGCANMSHNEYRGNCNVKVGIHGRCMCGYCRVWLSGYA